MFSTLRQDKKAGLQVESAFSASTQIKLPSCKNCQSGKLRCNREVSGCRNCVLKKLRCEYSTKSNVTKPRSKQILTRLHRDALKTTDLQQHARRDESNHVEDTINQALQPITGSGDADFFNFLNEDMFSRGMLGDTPPTPYLDNLISTDDNLQVERLSEYTEHQLFSQLNNYPTPSSSLHQVTLSPLPTSTQSLRRDPPLWTPVQASCCCQSSAISLLEAVSISQIQGAVSTVPHSLNLTKRAITECRSLLACKRCSRMSDFLMLLILLLKKVCGTFRQVIALLTEQYYKVVGIELRSETHLEILENSLDTAHRIQTKVLHEYAIDVEEEPCVFGGVVTLQAKKMIALMRLLKEILLQCERSDHITLLDSVTVQVREQLRVCNTACAV